MQTTHRDAIENAPPRAADEPGQRHVERLLRPKAKPEILLCATQRSGSTLVCEDLRNNRLGLAEEYFIPFLHSFVPAGQMLNTVRNHGTDQDGVFSIKIMASYAEQVDRILHGSPEAADGPLWQTLFQNFAQSVWVYISRRSIARQAISRLIARKSGINHAVARADASIMPGRSVIGLSTARPNLNIGLEQIDDECLAIFRERELWERFFAENAIKPIRLEYEDFCTDLYYIKDIADWLRLERPILNSNRALLRLSNETNEHLYTDYLECVARQVYEKMVASFPKQASSIDHRGESAAIVTPKTGAASGEAVTEAARKRWVNTQYYNAAEGMARGQWEKFIAPFLCDAPIDYSHTLELACGHGRMSNILLEKSSTFIGVDILEENIQYCRNRFSESDTRRFLLNDGVSLSGVVSESITFGFCFDSMVHFSEKVIHAYLSEFRRILVPGGYVFLHHSNYDKNPNGDFARAPHARNFMTKELFQSLANDAGLETVRAKVIDWGGGKNLCIDHDCLSLLRRPEAVSITAPAHRNASEGVLEPQEKQMLIFTPEAGFVEASALGYDRKGLNRMNARYRTFIKPIAEQIRGKRILDIASHDGRWTYACLVNGAAHVTGIEVRQELIAKSSHIITPENRERTRFIHGNLFDVMPGLLQSGEKFDIIFCLGIFYHIMDHYRLMGLMTAFNPELIIMDTGLVDADEPLIQLTTELSENVLNGVGVPGAKDVAIGIVSRGGIELMANTCGYSVQYQTWERKNTSDPSGLVDYLSTNKLGRRRYSFYLRPSI